MLSSNYHSSSEMSIITHSPALIKIKKKQLLPVFPTVALHAIASTLLTNHSTNNIRKVTLKWLRVNEGGKRK